MVRVVPSGDLGLDVLLGGGWRLVKRLDDAESATVVVRGGPGAGKTILGIHVALELARALGGDVVVGCVEILPTEYIAQLESTRPTLASERVIMLSHESTSKPSDEPRIYVGLMLDLDPDQPDLVASLEALQVATAAAGGRPVVFLVDSLIEGYGIGSSSERLHVDAAMKFAAKHGVGIVFCEESTSDAPSPWVFAADTVLQLGVESRERGRWIEVKKHRFGPSATGRHEIDLVASNSPAIYPAIHAWQSPWVPNVLARHWVPPAERRAPTPLKWNGSPDLPAALWFIASADEHLARHFAETLAPFSGDAPRSEAVLHIRFDPLPVGGSIWLHDAMCGGYVALADGEDRGLRHMLQLFIVAQTVSIDRVVVGDFEQALALVQSAKWADVLRTFAGIVTDAGFGIPIVAYETSPRGSNLRTSATPALAAAADIVVTLDATPAEAMSAHPVQVTIFNRWTNSTLRKGLPRQFVLVDRSPRPMGRE